MTGARALVLPPPVVDWWRVITDLTHGQGMSQRAIAAECECDHATINRLRNDVHASPLYVTGVRILALWMVRLDKGAADVPMVRTSTMGGAQHARVNPPTGAPQHVEAESSDRPHAGGACPAAIER